MKKKILQSMLKHFIWTGIIFSSSLMVSRKIVLSQMMVNPIVIEAETKKGQAKGSFSITNTSSSPLRARAVAEPFSYGKQGFESLKTSPTDLTPYLNLSPREFTLQPGQTRQIRLSAQLLPSLANREFRAVIFTDNLTAEEQAKSGTQTTILPRIGVTFYVRHGNIEPELGVEQSSISADQKMINLVIKNSGNATVRPAVRWKIMDKDQLLVGGQSDNMTIIAGGDREIPLSIALEKPLSAGSYQLAGELIWKKGKQQQVQPFSTPLVIK
jgi:P pilus assembly chaperone PapD